MEVFGSDVNRILLCSVSPFNDILFFSPFRWGKRKLGDSDSEDDSDEGEEGENQKSVIIDIGSHSDSSKEAEGSSGSITDGKLDAGFLDQGSSGGGSEEEDNLLNQVKVWMYVDAVMMALVEEEIILL